MYFLCTLLVICYGGKQVLSFVSLQRSQVSLLMCWEGFVMPHTCSLTSNNQWYVSCEIMILLWINLFIQSNQNWIWRRSSVMQFKSIDLSLDCWFLSGEKYFCHVLSFAMLQWMVIISTYFGRNGILIPDLMIILQTNRMMSFESDYSFEETSYDFIWSRKPKLMVLDT
jgi:hypothetical protein